MRGLLDQLGYRYPKRGFLRRATVAPAAFRPVAWCLGRVLPTLDRRQLKLTGGRISLSALVAGTPVITLTTRGARTGQARTSHLLISPGYGAYRARLATRGPKVFVLEIDPDAPGERETSP